MYKWWYNVDTHIATRFNAGTAGSSKYTLIFGAIIWQFCKLYDLLPPHHFSQIVKCQCECTSEMPIGPASLVASRHSNSHSVQFGECLNKLLNPGPHKPLLAPKHPVRLVDGSNSWHPWLVFSSYILPAL